MAMLVCQTAGIVTSFQNNLKEFLSRVHMINQTVSISETVSITDSVNNFVMDCHSWKLWLIDFVIF